jgi:hypothetical protein
MAGLFICKISRSVMVRDTGFPRQLSYKQAIMKNTRFMDEKGLRQK